MLTSGTQCCEQMSHKEYCKAVSQSCVSHGKVGGKCLKQPEPNQHTQQQSAATSNVVAGKPVDFRNKGDRDTPYRSGISMGQPVEASGQLATVSILKQEKIVQQEPTSLIISEAPIKTGTLQKPQYNEEKDMQ